MQEALNKKAVTDLWVNGLRFPFDYDESSSSSYSPWVGVGHWGAKGVAALPLQFSEQWKARKCVFYKRMVYVSCYWRCPGTSASIKAHLMVSLCSKVNSRGKDEGPRRALSQLRKPFTWVWYTETRMLLGGNEERSLSPKRDYWFALQANKSMNFLSTWILDCLRTPCYSPQHQPCDQALFKVDALFTQSMLNSMHLFTFNRIINGKPNQLFSLDLTQCPCAFFGQKM